ncbi:MAG: helicase-exonuclease AddAB subunit AddA [Clostridiales bacterium]|nr:helicase-exonuclease AddAB subunit AddA [Clostridiales bacterium]
MNWTKEQLQAIEIKDKSILVSAAAGSGKTAVLVERIKKLILEDGISLDEMLVVTFTNAAASEMREKIVASIPEQIHNIHKSHISTFHSFALDVIRRYYHLINIEPSFNLCDDAQRIILQQEAIEDLFELNFIENNQDFISFLNQYSGSKNEEDVKNIILQTYEFIRSLPNPFEWLVKNIEALNCDVEGFKNSQAFKEIIEEIDEEISNAIASYRKVCSMLEENEVESLAIKAKEDLEMLIGVKDSFEKEYEKGVKALNSIEFNRFTVRRDDKQNYEAIKDDIKIIRDQVKDNLKRLTKLYCAKSLNEYVNEINHTYAEAKTLFRLVKDFDSLYRIRKEKKGVIDYSDIEHYALEILSNEEASSEYRNKFKYIFIDEYQDSNLIQETIISKIQRDNNVFMVGDVKQSIYKFRLAEPEIFINKYLKFKHDTGPNIKLDLNKNFRSKGPIIEIVNDIFSRIMTKRIAGMDYDEDAALYKGLKYTGELEHPVELHLVDEQQMEDIDLDDEIVDMKKAEIEAFIAASLIKRAKGLPYYDEKLGEERVLQNKDIVILLRSTERVGQIYYEALQQEGIPAYIDIGEGYFDTIEISVFLNLLNIIDNKKQDVPLISVLRSPIFSFSINELAEIRVEKRKGSYYSAFYDYSKYGQNVSLKEKCNKVLLSLANWKEKSKLLPLPDFIWELILETGYYNYVGALPLGNQRQANLRALVDKASIYENGHSKGLFGFINFIEAIKKRKIAIPPVKTIGESDDVVRIMTVHKSKGLEFPMVLVGDLGRRFYREAGNHLSLHKDLGIALKDVDRKQGYWRRTILHNCIDARRERESLAEEIRILYVALTRAKDKLVLLGTVKDIDKVLGLAAIKKDLGVIKGNSYLDYLLPALSGSDKIIFEKHDRGDIGHIKDERQKNLASLQKYLESGFKPSLELANEIYKRFDWQYAYPKALKTKSKYSVSELSSSRETSIISVAKATTSLGAERGTVYHKIMEYIPFDREYDINAIHNYIDDMVNREILTKEEVELIEPAKIEQFFRSEIGKRACRSNDVYKEVSFNHLVVKDGEEIIVQGTIDCYFKENDKYILLDYKSNYIASDKSIESLKENYTPQLKLYKQALEEIRGIKVDEVYLYLFELGKEVRLNIN